MWTTVEIAPPVSAREILSRSKSAEDDRIRQVPDAIVYQKLRVMRRAAGASSEERASLEIWNDSTGKRYRRQPGDHRGIPLVLSRDRDRFSAVNSKDHRSAEPLLADLEQVYRKNRMNDRRPLSHDGYMAWRDTIRAKSEQVREIPLPDGAKAWGLSATAEGPHENDEIIQAELVDRWITVVFTGVILPSVSTEQAMDQLLKAFAPLQAGIESLDLELAHVSAAGKLQ